MTREKQDQGNVMIWPLSIVHQHSTGLGFHGRLLQHAPAEPPYHWLPHTWGIMLFANCQLQMISKHCIAIMILYRKALIQGGNTTAKRRGTTRSLSFLSHHHHLLGFAGIWTGIKIELFKVRYWELYEALPLFTNSATAEFSVYQDANSEVAINQNINK